MPYFEPPPLSGPLRSVLLVSVFLILISCLAISCSDLYPLITEHLSGSDTPVVLSDAAAWLYPRCHLIHNTTDSGTIF